MAITPPQLLTWHFGTCRVSTFLTTVMANPNARERRRTKPGADDAKSQPKDSKNQNDASGTRNAEETVQKTNSGSSLRSLLIYAIIFATLAFYLRDFFKVLLEPWIDFADSKLHGVTSSAPGEIVADIEKRNAIVDSFKHVRPSSMHGAPMAKRDAMGADEYHPISHQGTNLSDAGGIGYTVVDSLDTMMMMGLDNEVARARKWIDEKLSFEKDGSFSTFETTIRVLGGLLSAYHLSGGDKLYLEKAVDLADRMLPAFDTPSGLPLSSVNLAKRVGIPDRDNNGWVSTAEVSTLQLELRYLSELTDDDTYWRAAEKVMYLIRQSKINPHVVTIFMDPESGAFIPFDIRLGSRGDSYYEYLLKQYLQTNRTEEVYKSMYLEAMDAVNKHLVKRSKLTSITYTSELIPERRQGGDTYWRLVPKQDHLVCFLGGSLMLGATTAGALKENVSIPPHPSELSPDAKRDWRVGVELIRTCMLTHKTQTLPNDGVDSTMMGAPRDWYIKGAKPGHPPPLDARYILRPETVESLFIAYRLTGDNKYREYGWRIFQAIEKHCKVSTGGYAAVLNVDELPVTLEDKMETFLLSETLKYLYLLFSDADDIPLSSTFLTIYFHHVILTQKRLYSEYVFNTEAHPLPIFNPSIRTGFS
ncbi:glycoside hydrolase [Sanghuangporus baumii]|uniref:alpha-1,2-Mannosidase n=1 Tax=Sanghuangporus baumii TaxID=108892 RepID=A0A9Q5HZR7_SANBA|nr:glycoside hydrolase [Sanghuangporus baumii]